MIGASLKVISQSFQSLLIVTIDLRTETQHVQSDQFESSQASDVYRACFNIWSKIYDADDLLVFSRCHDNGDLFSLQYANGELHGDTPD